MMKRYWKLARDPFGPQSACYVPTPTHVEAEERLVYAIEAGERLASLRAAGGLGKSLVLARVLARVRGPARRVVRAVGAGEGTSLLAALAEGLGRRVPPGTSRAVAWRTLDQAARLCRLQGQGVVLAVDECQLLAEPADRLDLDRLIHLDPHPAARLTVLQIGQPGMTAEPSDGPWGLAIRLNPLGRADSERYLLGKLASAGRTEPTFTPRAMTRLHAYSGGNPRGLDRLASLALMAGTLQKREIITPDVVEGIAAECIGEGGGRDFTAENAEIAERR